VNCVCVLLWCAHQESQKTKQNIIYIDKMSLR